MSKIWKSFWINYCDNSRTEFVYYLIKSPCINKPQNLLSILAIADSYLKSVDEEI